MTNKASSRRFDLPQNSALQASSCVCEKGVS